VREALAARSDDDFIAEPAPPRRPRRKAAAKPARRAGWLARLGPFALRYPLEIAITAGLLAAGSAIVWNALALQTARHPAPWFGRAEAPAPLPPARPVPPAAAPVPAAPAPSAPQVSVPVAPRATAPRDAIGDLIRGGDAPAPLAVPAARPPSAPPAPPARPAPAPAPAQPAPRDRIADMIRLGDAPPVPPGLVGRSEPARLVSSAQRALAKLNYLSAKPDGQMGPGTRQAIERFERDRRLPVTGELGARTARELAAASGLPVE
jgi:Putative peptidoglycan binding domain